MMRLSKLRLLCMSLLTGATVWQLGGCDPTVKDTIFSGIQASTVGLVTAFVNALFLAIQPSSDQTITTTKAVIEQLIDKIC